MPKELGASQLPGDKRRWSDYVIPYKFKDRGQSDRVRPFGLVWTDFRHMVTTKTGKVYYEFCHGWDIENEQFFDDREKRCPCCALNIAGSHRYFMNVVVIDEVERKPGNPPADWTPVRMMEMALTLFRKIVELAEANKGFDVTDPEKGAILLVKFDDSKEPANKYGAHVEERNYSLSANGLADFMVVQKYPKDRPRVVKGDGVKPAGFEYIRVVNTRDDMIKSLKRQGYYASAEGEAETEESSSSSSRSVSAAKADDFDFDTPIQDANEHVTRAANSTAKVEVIDEEPMPRARAKQEIMKDDIPFDERTSRIESNTAMSAQNSVAKPAAVIKSEAKDPEYDQFATQRSLDCKADFGRFVSSSECYTDCPVVDECRSLSEKNETHFKKSATKQPPQHKGYAFDDSL